MMLGTYVQTIEPIKSLSKKTKISVDNLKKMIRQGSVNEKSAQKITEATGGMVSFCDLLDGSIAHLQSMREEAYRKKITWASGYYGMDEESVDKYLLEYEKEIIKKLGQ